MPAEAAPTARGLRSLLRRLFHKKILQDSDILAVTDRPNVLLFYNSIFFSSHRQISEHFLFLPLFPLHVILHFTREADAHHLKRAHLWE